ncbi:MAG: hypothetical protein Edafosvirus2_18 [Edafosvirus sp.]|uniref:Uncharacterized protein n=1 Tax=Edafosvirus sp. TaxID=2487765 RepID=A0A3G4ZWP6_9VIRU|nr:MAG: hypothetical protein Edafosvirus2_18 [Edafosvirus sp.]
MVALASRVLRNRRIKWAVAGTFVGGALFYPMGRIATSRIAIGDNNGGVFIGGGHGVKIGDSSGGISIGWDGIKIGDKSGGVYIGWRGIHIGDKHSGISLGGKSPWE